MPDFFMQGTGYPGILGRGHTREVISSRFIIEAGDLAYT